MIEAGPKQRSTISFGLAGLCAQSPSGTREEFHEQLGQLVRATQLAEVEGLSTAWLSEHHFSADAYLPSPVPVLAALAAKTERLTLSTNVALGPLYQPIRLAEDLAVVDHLSRGRLMIGLGLGYRQEEFDGLGVDRRRRGRAIEELVTCLRGAWAGDPIAPTGGGAAVTPPPYQTGGPPILLGALVEQGVRRSVQLADGWIGGVFDHVGQLRKRLEWLIDEADGDLDGFHVVLTFAGFIAARDAWEVARSGIGAVEDQMLSWLRDAHGERAAHRGATAPIAAPPDYYVVGSPPEFAAGLTPWVELLGSLPAGVHAHVAARLTYPQVPEAANLESVRLFAREVVPRLRERLALHGYYDNVL